MHSNYCCFDGISDAFHMHFDFHQMSMIFINFISSSDIFISLMNLPVYPAFKLSRFQTSFISWTKYSELSFKKLWIEFFFSFFIKNWNDFHCANSYDKWRRHQHYLNRANNRFRPKISLYRLWIGVKYSPWLLLEFCINVDSFVLAPKMWET